MPKEAAPMPLGRPQPRSGHQQQVYSQSHQQPPSTYHHLQQYHHLPRPPGYEYYASAPSYQNESPTGAQAPQSAVRDATGAYDHALKMTAKYERLPYATAQAAAAFKLPPYELHPPSSQPQTSVQHKTAHERTSHSTMAGYNRSSQSMGSVQYDHKMAAYPPALPYDRFSKKKLAAHTPEKTPIVRDSYGTTRNDKKTPTSVYDRPVVPSTSYERLSKVMVSSPMEVVDKGAQNLSYERHKAYRASEYERRERHRRAVEGADRPDVQYERQYEAITTVSGAYDRLGSAPAAVPTIVSSYERQGPPTSSYERHSTVSAAYERRAVFDRAYEAAAYERRQFPPTSAFSSLNHSYYTANVSGDESPVTVSSDSSEENRPHEPLTHETSSLTHVVASNSVEGNTPISSLENGCPNSSPVVMRDISPSCLNTPLNSPTAQNQNTNPPTQIQNTTSRRNAGLTYPYLHIISPKLRTITCYANPETQVRPFRAKNPYSRPLSPFKSEHVDMNQDFIPNQHVSGPNQADCSPNQTVSCKNQLDSGQNQTVSWPKQPVDGPKQPVDGPKHTVSGSKRTVSRPNQTVSSPNQTVSCQNQLVSGQNQTVSWPKQPVDGPKQPVDGPKHTVSGSKWTVSRPNQTVSSPNQADYSPNQTVSCQNQLVSGQSQTVSGPKQPVDGPKHTISGSKQTVSRPNQTVSSPNQADYSPNQTVSCQNQLVSGQNQTVSWPKQPVDGPKHTVSGSKQTVSSPNQADYNPNQTVSCQNQLVSGQNQTVSWPKQPVDGPKHTVSGSKRTLSRPNQTVSSPKQPVDGPTHTVSGPKRTVSRPNRPVSGPKETISCPKQPVSGPKRTVSRPNQPVSGPKKTISCANQQVSGTKQTISGPNQSVSGPNETIFCPKQPVSGPKYSVSVPKRTVSRPNPPVSDPTQTMSGLNQPVSGPKETISFPNQPVSGPIHTISGPNQPVFQPYQQVSCPKQHVSCPNHFPNGPISDQNVLNLATTLPETRSNALISTSVRHLKHVACMNMRFSPYAIRFPAPHRPINPSEAPCSCFATTWHYPYPSYGPTCAAFSQALYTRGQERPPADEFETKDVTTSSIYPAKPRMSLLTSPEYLSSLSRRSQQTGEENNRSGQPSVIVPPSRSPADGSGTRKRLREGVKPEPLPLLTLDTVVSYSPKPDTEKPSIYMPTVEPISPTSPPDAAGDDCADHGCGAAPKSSAKDNLLLDISRVDREINKIEHHIFNLKRKQVELEQKAKRSSETESSDEAVEAPLPQHFSLSHKVYSENRRRAKEAHAALSHLGPPIDLPLYNQPSDTSVYQENRRKHLLFKGRLIAHLRRRRREKCSSEIKMTEDYARRTETWNRLVEKMETSPERKRRDAENRELFEKTFPKIRKEREDRERFLRVGSRVKSDADLEEIMDNLHEQEMEVKKMRDYAAVPPMLLSSECRRCVYVNTNGLLEDFLSEYKDRRIVNVWTDPEKDIFKEKYLLYPKNFGAVAAFLERKSVSDCVQYYYLSKKTENYKRLLKKTGQKNKSGRSRNKAAAPPVDAASHSTLIGPTIAPRFQRDYKPDGAATTTTTGTTGADPPPPDRPPTPGAPAPCPPQEPPPQPVASDDSSHPPTTQPPPELPPPPDVTASRPAPAAPQLRASAVVAAPPALKPLILPFPDIPIVVIDDSDDSNSSSHFPYIRK